MQERVAVAGEGGGTGEGGGSGTVLSFKIALQDGVQWKGCLYLDEKTSARPCRLVAGSTPLPALAPLDNIKSLRYCSLSVRL